MKKSSRTHTMLKLAIIVLCMVLLPFILISAIETAFSPRVSEGVVVEMQHVLPSQSRYTDSVEVFGFDVHLPWKTKIYESWKVLLSDGDQAHWVEVSESQYACMHVGAYVDIKQRCLRIEEQK